MENGRTGYSRCRGGEQEDVNQNGPEDVWGGNDAYRMTPDASDDNIELCVGTVKASDSGWTQDAQQRAEEREKRPYPVTDGEMRPMPCEHLVARDQPRLHPAC